MEEMLTVGCDCSGISSVSNALKRMGVKHRHVFCSESHRTARKWLRERVDPEILYEDVTKRDHRRAPRVALYVASPPCVAYSGLSQSPFDKDDPSCHAFEHCLRYIEAKRPKLVVIENVKRLTSRGHEVYEEALERIERAGYAVEAKVLDAKDYGVPQSRPRLWIVGVRQGVVCWPKPIELKASCLDALIPTRQPCRAPPSVLRKVQEWRADGLLGTHVGLFQPNDFGFQLASKRRGKATIDPAKSDVCPCMTAKQPGIFVNGHDRLLHGCEAMWLMGNTTDIPSWCSDGVARRLCGNAQVVDVLCHLLAGLLGQINIRASPPAPLPKNVALQSKW